MSSVRASRGPTLAATVAVLWRRSVLVVVITMVAAAAAFGWAVTRPASFVAHTQVLVSRQDLAGSLLAVPDSSISGQDATRFANTNAAIARSSSVVDAAAKKAAIPGVDGGVLFLASTVEPASDADIMSFGVKSATGDVAIKLANAYATAFVAARTKLDSSTISQALKVAQTQLAELKARGQENTTLYQSLQTQEQTLSTLDTLQTARASILAPATVAVDTSPRPFQLTAIGIILGGILAIIAAFIREAFDTRIRRSSEIAEILGVPVLARVRRTKGPRTALPVVAEPLGAEAEAIRFLRSSIEMHRTEGSAFVLVVTSAKPGEGKSTTAASLASSLALNGWKVALLDGDARLPSVARMLNVPAQPPFRDVADRKITLRRGLSTISFVDPDGASHGRMHAFAPEPSIGLRSISAVFADGAGDLADDHDFVIIDAPPLLAGGDTLAICGVADATLLVCRIGTVTSNDLVEVRQSLAGLLDSCVGFVCTNTKPGELVSVGAYAAAADDSVPLRIVATAGAMRRRASTRRRSTAPSTADVER